MKEWFQSLPFIHTSKTDLRTKNPIRATEALRLNHQLNLFIVLWPKVAIRVILGWSLSCLFICHGSFDSWLIDLEGYLHCYLHSKRWWHLPFSSPPWSCLGLGLSLPEFLHCYQVQADRNCRYQLTQPVTHELMLRLLYHFVTIYS